MSDKPQDDEPVGYGNPPVHSRFQKGRSGNPGGRPRSKASTILSKILDKQVNLVGGGSCTRLERLMTQLVVAAEGDDKYMRLLLSLLDRIDSAPEEIAADETE